MKILAIEREQEGINWDAEKETLEAEAKQVYELYFSGYLREIYFNEHHCAVISLECESKEKAIELLYTLPLAKKKLIKFEVMELRPYTGYQRLMKATKPPKDENA